jgi:4-aminobutyrate aminotransferase-like enzyme/GNAT superfamily N-acetyltransferase
MDSPPRHRSARLAELEDAQRREEVPAGALVEREVTRVRVPADGLRPRSAALLERLYAGGLVPREKKELVVDTRRSWGPYLVSVDDDPWAILDACSQIATLPQGLGDPWIHRALDEGRFGRYLWENVDTTVDPPAELATFARELLARAPRGLDHVAFVAAGGAEANEKALWMARLQLADSSPRRRVLALENGFHGRTWATIGATWNPAKRGPFELSGFEAVFVPPTLEAVERALVDRGGELYAAIAEPMLAEGGDVHLEASFYRGLRRLTRDHALPLVIDEVQTGFATGDAFFWWSALGLGAQAEDAPDFLTVAKKAQLGAVLSRRPDPAPAPVHVASLLRGLLHLEAAEHGAGLASWVRPRLEGLAREFPHLVGSPRVVGTTFAFELPDAATMERFLARRFELGLFTYPAGARTLRFRLHGRFRRSDVDELFVRLRRGLLAAAGDGDGHRAGGLSAPARPEVTVRPVEPQDWAQILAVEEAVYEPARRTPETVLRAAAQRGVGLVAFLGARLAGFCFAGPVEDHADSDGPQQDPSRGRGETLYSVDLTVAPGIQGAGVGRALKRAQVVWARQAGYRWVSGRNKVGATDSMMALNRALGAYEVARYDGQYDGAGVAEYYRIPLRGPELPPAPPAREPLDLASGLQRPCDPRATELARRELVGPTVNKLNLSNFATPDVVAYFEHLREILPRGCSHVYTTSSRDEALDKCLRALRWRRRAAHLAVGIEGGYVGHTTAAARSLSDPAGFPEPFALYPWLRLPHPELDDGLAAERELNRAVADHGADALLGVVAEIVGERSGRVLRGAGAVRLAAACRRHGVPLVLVETASGGYRTGAGAWGVDTLPGEVVPDGVVWYPGSQLGHVFTSAQAFVPDPLALISTWDGDELSMIRTHELLRTAWRIDTAPAIRALESLVGAVSARFAGRVGGLGLYRTVTVDAGTVDVAAAALLAAGARCGRGAPGVLIFAPALDVASDDVRRVAARIAASCETPAS